MLVQLPTLSPLMATPSSRRDLHSPRSSYRGPSHRGTLAVPPPAALAVALPCHCGPLCRHRRLVYLAILIVARLGDPRLAAVWSPLPSASWLHLRLPCLPPSFFG